MDPYLAYGQERSVGSSPVGRLRPCRPSPEGYREPEREGPSRIHSC